MGFIIGYYKIYNKSGATFSFNSFEIRSCQPVLTLTSLLCNIFLTNSNCESHIGYKCNLILGKKYSAKDYNIKIKFVKIGIICIIGHIKWRVRNQLNGETRNEINDDILF